LPAPVPFQDSVGHGCLEDIYWGFHRRWQAKNQRFFSTGPGRWKNQKSVVFIGHCHHENPASRLPPGFFGDWIAGTKKLATLMRKHGQCRATQTIFWRKISGSDF
jgi:hypothetical protein